MNLNSRDIPQRLFFALWPEPPLARQIWQQTRHPCNIPGSRPLLPGQLHLTLRFAGSVDPSQHKCLARAAGQIRQAPFCLQLADVGCWPKPKVLWLAPSETPGELRMLAQALEAVCVACGLPAERGDFSPHMTLARNVRDAVPPARVAPALCWPVSAFYLVQSQTCPEGAKYTLLQSWSLQ